MIAKITSQFIPENEQEDYMNSYINTTYPILEMIDFEELTEGASFKDMPDWARMSIAGGALLIPAGLGIVKYNKNNEKEGDNN